jgi:hypothetical protein
MAVLSTVVQRSRARLRERLRIRVPGLAIAMEARGFIRENLTRQSGNSTNEQSGDDHLDDPKAWTRSK